MSEIETICQLQWPMFSYWSVLSPRFQILKTHSSVWHQASISLHLSHTVEIHFCSERNQDTKIRDGSPESIRWKSAALNQFYLKQRLRELPECAELLEVEVCTVQLFQIVDRWYQKFRWQGSRKIDNWWKAHARIMCLDIRNTPCQACTCVPVAKVKNKKTTKNKNKKPTGCIGSTHSRRYGRLIYWLHFINTYVCLGYNYKKNYK